MSPEEIKALRTELGCTARELATALGIEQETVLAWERGDLFPTKKHVDRMGEIRKQGPSAVPKQQRKKGGKAPASPMAALADPATWKIVRKLIANPELFARVAEIAEVYPDPAETPDGTAR